MKCKRIKTGLFAALFLGILLFGVNWNIEVFGSETIDYSTEHSCKMSTLECKTCN